MGSEMCIRDRINNSYMGAFNEVMCNKEYALIYKRGLEDKPLDEIEVVQFSQFINRFFAVLESAVTIAKQDMLMSDDYDIEYLYDYPMANRLLETQIGSAWFKEEAPLTFSEEFLENIRKFQPVHIFQIVSPSCGPGSDPHGPMWTHMGPYHPGLSSSLHVSGSICLPGQLLDKSFCSDLICFVNSLGPYASILQDDD